jgi:GGDEF domain-containing protein
MMPTLGENIQQIEIIATLAQANHLLGNYQAALDLYLKILRLRFEYDRIENIELLYYKIATEYRKLGQFDDAYNAYWEARRFGLKKSEPFQVAYAELGLAELLLQQNKYQQAFDSLSNIERLFRSDNHPNEYLSVIIALADAAMHLNKKILAYQLLTKAEQVLPDVVLNAEQIRLYRLLADKYNYQGDYKKSAEALAKYIELQQAIVQAENKIAQVKSNAKLMTDKSRELGIQIAEQSSLKKNFNQKFTKQALMIEFLIICVVLLLFGVVILAFKLRNLRLNHEYLETEKPLHYIANSRITKQMYQLEYIKARKYEYPLTVVYLKVNNWSDIKYHFSKKVVNEVAKSIATLLNEQVSQFDIVGRLSEDEYLLLFPHQTAITVSVVLAQIIEALNLRLFANLGKFTVLVEYASGAPDVQDIDPFVFLSSLTEKTQSSVKGLQEK